MTNDDLSIIEWVEENTPGLLRSIGDDDICSDCVHLIYRPGEDSVCTQPLDSYEWPSEVDENDLVVECDEHE